MRSPAGIAAGLLLFSMAAGIAQPPASQPPAKRNAPGTVPQSNSERGEQVFRHNCSRCHKSPEALPQSVTGTVALHMRIRAGLSEKDYKRLLAFLNP